MEMVKVGMADLKIASAPKVLTTLGLGSCVGIVIYDSFLKIGGLAHIMLPSSKSIKNNSNKAKFADTGVDLLIEKLLEAGALKTRLVSKIAGGAQMFSFKGKNEIMKIGERNVEAVKKQLSKHKIKILAEDVKGRYGRTIEFYTETGVLRIKTIGHGYKEI